MSYELHIFYQRNRNKLNPISLKNRYKEQRFNEKPTTKFDIQACNSREGFGQHQKSLNK